MQPTAGFPKLCHCPYCEHQGDLFLTPDQKSSFEAAAAARFAEVAKALLLKRGSAPMSARVAVPRDEIPDFPDTAMFPCCDGSIQHDGSCSTLYCPFCGKTNTAT